MWLCVAVAGGRGVFKAQREESAQDERSRGHKAFCMLCLSLFFAQPDLPSLRSLPPTLPTLTSLLLLCAVLPFCPCCSCCCALYVTYRWPLAKPVCGVLFLDYGTDLDSGESVLGDPAGTRGKPGR